MRRTHGDVLTDRPTPIERAGSADDGVAAPAAAPPAQREPELRSELASSPDLLEKVKAMMGPGPGGLAA